MTATRDAAGNLVITTSEMFIRVLRVSSLVALVAVWFAHAPMHVTLGRTAVLGLFALVLTIADERTSFVFNRARGVLHWRKATPFRRKSGEVEFKTITSLSLERDFSTGGRGSARRLVIHTDAGPLPLTNAYTGVGTAAERAGDAIRAYLRECIPGLDLPFVKS